METLLLLSSVVLLVVVFVQHRKLNAVVEARRKHKRLPR